MKWNISLPKSARSKKATLLAVACVVIGGWYWYAGAARKPDQDPARAVTVTRGTIEELVTSQGKLEAKT